MVQVQVLAATQLEDVSGNNTIRNLRIFIYTAILYLTSILILLLSVSNANSFLPAMVTMHVARHHHLPQNHQQQVRSFIIMTI